MVIENCVSISLGVDGTIFHPGNFEHNYNMGMARHEITRICGISVVSRVSSIRTI